MHIKSNFTSEQELKETLDFIYQKSKEGKSFNGILEAAFNEVTIITAIHNIKSNKGANTPGIDGAKMDKYLQMGKEELITLIRDSTKEYKPKPVRRTFILKKNGKQRPLGIPSALDKIIQECIKIIIEPICEAKFYPQSFGFRPYRATNHAMKEAITLLSLRTAHKPVIAIEGDIESFFDNINHHILLQKLYRIGVKDKRILSMIKQMLEAGYVYEDKQYTTEVGAVQGGIISPLFGNVYLNDFDWMMGRMYHHPKTKNKHESGERTKLKSNGIIPKYLVRYCDDWLVLTSRLNEAIRILKHLQKYYKHRLKLNLSREKTLITNLTEKRTKFLGYELEAKPPRASPRNVENKGLVGKFYPDKEKAIAKTKTICKEIWKLKRINSSQELAAQIEKINAIITGTAEYYKVAICSNIYAYMDDRIKQTAYRTFRKIYGKSYKEYYVPLSILSNRPQRHEKRLDKTYAVKHQDMYIGITKAYITHSQWDKCNFNQKTTPYSEEGRNLHIRRVKSKRIKSLPLNRPPIYDELTLFTCNDKSLSNFEYYMNREYAYNRDKGRCRICGNYLKVNLRHCHRINPALPIKLINKVPNLAWLCLSCINIVRTGSIPVEFNEKMKSKVLKFQENLKVLN